MSNNFAMEIYLATDLSSRRNRTLLPFALASNSFMGNASFKHLFSLRSRHLSNIGRAVLRNAGGARSSREGEREIAGVIGA